MTPNNFRVKNGLTVGNNTNITGYVNASSYVNATSFNVGATVVANTTGVFATHLNGASGSGYALLTGALFTGTVNAATVSVGTSFIANTTRVVVGTSTGLQANGGIGTAGQVLHSNGTTVYWAADDGITSIVAANGLSGGTITSTGQLDVVGGAGLISNSSGVHVGSANGISVAADAVGVTTGSTLTVNATGIHVNTSNLSIATSQLTGDVALGANTSGNYVATITNANGISGSSSAEGGTPTIGVVTGSTLTVNTTGIHVNSALSIASLALSGDITVSGNLTVSGTRTYVNTTTLDIGDNIFTLNADLGAVAPSQDAGIEIMRGTSANVQFLWDETNDRWSTNGQPLAVSSFIAAGAASGITTLAAGNTTITGFVNATSSVNAASHTVGTNFIANSTQTTFGTPVLFNNQQQLRFQTTNTSAYVYFTQQNDDNFVFYSSNTTYGARAVWAIFGNSITSNLQTLVPFQPTAGFVANSSLGSAGQVLKTNGSGVYWDTAGGTGTVTSVATANGLSGGTITATGTLGVVTGPTLTVNSTGIHVNTIATSQLTGDVALGTNTSGNYVATIAAGNGISGSSSAEGGTPTIAVVAGTNGGLVSNSTGVFVSPGSTLTVNATGVHVNSTLALTSLNLSGGFTANGGLGTAGQVLHSNGTATYWAADDNAGGTVTSIATANGLTGGTITTTGTLGVASGSTLTVNTTGIHVNSTLSITSLTLAGALSGVTTAAMGNTTITGFANVTTTLQVGTNTATFGTAAYLVSNGNFGVGTSSPGRRLSVQSAAYNVAQFSSAITASPASLDAGEVITISGTSAVSGVTYGAADARLLAFGVTSANSVYIRAGDLDIVSTNNIKFSPNNGTEAGRFVANGNFGIGTTTPANKLHIAGSAGTLLRLDGGAGGTGTRDIFISEFDTAAYGGIIRYDSGADTFTFGTVDNSTVVNAINVLRTSGNVGIGTTAPGYKLEVNGSFAATTKSFVIDHPTKPGMKLRYGSLEGPENGVYVRGRLRAGEKIIQLPDYWEGLVDQDTYTVNLTPVGKHQELYVEHIASDYIIVGGENIDCFYTVFAERNDVEKLEVEF